MVLHDLMRVQITTLFLSAVLFLPATDKTSVLVSNNEILFELSSANYEQLVFIRWPITFVIRVYTVEGLIVRDGECALSCHAAGEG